MPHFVIQHDTLSAESEESLGREVERLIEVLNLIKTSNMPLSKSANVYYANILPGIELYTLLSSAVNVPLDDVQISALRAQIDQIPDNAEDLQEFVGRLKADGTAVGLVSFQNHAIALLGCQKVFDQGSLYSFYRAVFSIEDVQESGFHDLAIHAFPELHIHRQETQFNRFEKSYVQNRTIVVKHLGILNDHFRQIRDDCGGNTRCIIAHFAAAPHDVTLSPESVNTHGNTRAMKQREVRIGRDVYMCEWHTKLYYNTDRIHFNADSNPNIGGRILIGSFTGHFAT